MDLETIFRDSRITSALRIQLNQITVASQALERTVQAPHGIDYLAIINQNICRMMRMVSHMELTQRLLDSDPASFKPAPMDFSLLAEELGSPLESILAEIGIGFTFECPKPLLILADRELLRHMLLEMVFYVAVVGTDITLSVTKQHGTISLVLKDQGPGESAQRTRLPAVVEKYEEQASLELARQIAQLHGGSLMVSSDSRERILLTASIPAGNGISRITMESCTCPSFYGGFAPELISLSPLLPAKSFLPDNLG